MIRKATLAALLLTLASPAMGQSSPVQTRQVGSARLENVPEIPTEIRSAVQRYQNFREAHFEDWLPDGSMLITTRFGATTQVHHVAAPRRDRTQLTFHEEPVGDAQMIPGEYAFIYRIDKQRES